MNDHESVVTILTFFSLFIFISFLNLDPPEITVETPVVFTGEDQEAMLVCIVHGEAQPDVSTICVICTKTK